MIKKGICSFMLAASLLAAGCSRNTAVINTPEGTIHVNKGKQQVTITGKQGTMTLGTKIGEKDLGIPIYPGAVEKGGENATSNTAKGASSFTMADFTTPDSVKKVAAFYKSKLPTAAKMTQISTPGMQMVTFDLKGEKGSKGVHIQLMSDPKTKKTQIMIMTGTSTNGH
jgi:hypothetical protein